jgi:proline dehydrogenase
MVPSSKWAAPLRAVDPRMPKMFTQAELDENFRQVVARGEELVEQTLKLLRQ